MTFLWYVATPENTTASFDTDHITGDHPSKGTYQLAYSDKDTNTNPSYINGHNVSIPYTANYFYALTIDEEDQYDAKKYYLDEVKNVVQETPASLFDPDSLYRAETAYEGNLVVMQKFYTLPFSMDLHFAYRDDPFSSADMDFEKTT